MKKNEFKVTVTLTAAQFDQLELERSRRRRILINWSYSEILRDAFDMWFLVQRCDLSEIIQRVVQPEEWIKFEPLLQKTKSCNVLETSK
jgi:hypothetical protein